MIDHLVVAVADVVDAADRVQREWGVRLQPGGSHPAHGTHNMLLGAGPDRYVEWLAADPAVPAERRSARGQRVAAIAEPTVLEVLFRAVSIDALLADLPPRCTIEEDAPGRRLNPDGRTISWRRLRFRCGDHVLPDIIAWTSASPADGLPPAVRLTRFTISSPVADAIVALLERLPCHDSVETIISRGPHSISVRFETPYGIRTLTG